MAIARAHGVERFSGKTASSELRANECFAVAPAQRRLRFPSIAANLAIYIKTLTIYLTTPETPDQSLTRLPAVESRRLAVLYFCSLPVAALPCYLAFPACARGSASRCRPGWHVLRLDVAGGIVQVDFIAILIVASDQTQPVVTTVVSRAECTSL